MKSIGTQLQLLTIIQHTEFPKKYVKNVLKERKM